MDIRQWLDRLKKQVDGIKSVHSALEFDRVLKYPSALPAIFVIPTGRTMEANQYATEQVLQRDTREVMVTIAVKSLSDRRGGSAAEAIEAFITKIDNALVGWQPTDAVGPVTASNGTLQDISGGIYFWRLSYDVPFWVRNV